jgi:surfactin family lipopeptide synthetase C
MNSENIEAVYPLSPMQQGMYFHSELSPDSGVYIEQMNCEIEGSLSVDNFMAACQKVVDRHSILRTAFAGAKQGKLLQVVGKKVKLPFEILDMTDCSEENQQEKLTRLRLNESKIRFELGKAPLMRIKLIRLAAERFHFIWTHHHLLLDGWSVPIVLREVFLCYEAFRNGKTPALPPPHPFRDYIAWLNRQNLSKAETFWSKSLHGVSGATEIPKQERILTSEPPKIKSVELRVRFNPEESRNIKRFAQHEKITVNTLIQGAWAIVLGGLSGERDVLYGATVSGRPAELAGAGEMVGLFINTLPVRIRLDLEKETGNWLRNIQAEQTKSREFEYSPLTRIQKWAGIAAERKLFESILVFENYPGEQVVNNEINSLRISKFMYLDPPQAELLIMVVPGNELLIRFMFSSDRLPETAAQKLLSNLEKTIFSMIVGKNLMLKDLDFIKKHIKFVETDKEIEKSLIEDEFTF